VSAAWAQVAYNFIFVLGIIFFPAEKTCEERFESAEKARDFCEEII
jgi:hypothetical protein